MLPTYCQLQSTIWFVTGEGTGFLRQSGAAIVASPHKRSASTHPTSNWVDDHSAKENTGDTRATVLQGHDMSAVQCEESRSVPLFCKPPASLHHCFISSRTIRCYPVFRTCHQNLALRSSVPLADSSSPAHLLAPEIKS
jgi:hypothetical protein